MKTKSTIHSHISPANVGVLKLAPSDITAECISDLSKMGICLDASDVAAMAHYLGAGARNDSFMGLAMDADLTAPLTVGSVTTPVQFAQAWLPGVVRIVTSPRKIDNLIGITTQGDWADEEIVQSIIGNSGEAVQYTDDGNIPLANWNLNFITRTIVRFEQGFKVGRLEQERAAQVRIASADEKRYGVIESLEIIRNQVGFNGFNNGANRTFGILNDPELLAYNALPTGTWSTATYLQIINDLIFMASTLQNQSDGRIDPKTDNIKFVIATVTDQFLNKTSEFGRTVRMWIAETYPNWTIETAPQFGAANAGQNVAYLYAETVDMSGTDDSRTFIQVVPTKFRTLGVQQTAKGYIEDYSNATAGVLHKRPYANARFTDL